ncbi:hypothetical protein MKW98_031846 [Papaver atlanticum]|uniref:HXXXD-type acyl-transferase family protein n=1 Tax=Papaver atlanticum TaxID=357466 RepID=A0AAD4SFA4_9MAGN|nr:hypothetical protein MKW98_031846 [Papaver atlanticum]
MGSAKEVRLVSTTMVRPANYTSHKRIDLNSWDIKPLGYQYMQKGLLFTNLQQPLRKQGEETNNNGVGDMISHLKTSLSYTLDHFFPLAGRLGIEKHKDDDTISMYINCNFEGAEFIHATAEISVDDILSPAYIPQSIINPLFPLNGVMNYEGVSQPLLSIQVTELLGGIFIGCSANHSVCDGTSFWQFINTWSGICRSSNNYTPVCPVFERWFMNDTDCPLRLPSSFAEKFLKLKTPASDPIIPPLHRFVEKCFHFTKTNIARLKAAANSEVISTKENMLLSSLQAVLAHVWIAVTRARKSLNVNYNENEETMFGLMMSNRTKFVPPLPEAYFGNSLTFGMVIAKDDEVLEKGFGFLASLLKEVVNSHSDEKIKSAIQSWIKKPFILSSGEISGSGNKNLVARSSHRFNMYGNDFGWGRPVAVKAGSSGKSSGMTSVGPGPVEGSIDIEIVLPVEVFQAMESDAEFMEAFST